MTHSSKKQIILVVIASVFILMVFLSLAGVFNKKDSLQEAIQRYKMPANYSEADLIHMVELMRQDSEFGFYFKVLDNKKEYKVMAEAIAIILNAPTPENLLQEINNVYGNIRALSSLFYYFEHDEAFVQNPSEFPQIQAGFWDFLTEEFKLAILGVFYKVNYDNNFTFQWDDVSVKAAQKLRRLWAKQQNYQRKFKAR